MWTYQLDFMLCYNITNLLLADHENLRNCRFNMRITDSMILRTNALKGTKVDPGPHLHIRRNRIKGQRRCPQPPFAARADAPNGQQEQQRDCPLLPHSQIFWMDTCA